MPFYPFVAGGSGGSPSGSAGGDLGSTYPNPTVVATHLASALPVAQGGTAATSASAALTSLGAAALAGATFTGDVAPSVFALSDGASIAVNAALGNVATVTIAGSRTMAAPSNPVSGQVLAFDITQGSGGSHTITWSSSAGGYDFGAAGAPTLSTSAAAVDEVGFRYNAGLSKWVFLGSALGN